MAQDQLFQSSSIQPVFIALTACASIVILSALWVFITFSDLCCCLMASRHGDSSGKERSPTNETAPGPSSSGASLNKASKEEKSLAKTELTIEAETTSPSTDKQKKASLFTKKDQKKGPSQSHDKSVPMQDRIGMFEKSEPRSSADIIRIKDGTKPKKKKPTSKAFQEFETSGLLIGFGNVPRRTKEATEETDNQHLESRSSDDLERSGLKQQLTVQLPGLQSGSRTTHTHVAEHSNSNSHSNSLSRLTDDEGIHTMDEEDEFAAVARHSEVLKSFRRAPPPKNRSKARRHLRNKLVPGQDFQDFAGFDFPMEMDEEDENVESDTEAEATPRHSIDSIVTPSIDRSTPDDDTGTSGHHTGEDSPRQDTAEPTWGATPDTATAHTIPGPKSLVLVDSNNREQYMETGKKNSPVNESNIDQKPPIVLKESEQQSFDDVVGIAGSRNSVLKLKESLEADLNKDKSSAIVTMFKDDHSVKTDHRGARPKGDSSTEARTNYEYNQTGVLSPTFTSTTKLQLTSRFVIPNKSSAPSMSHQKQGASVPLASSNVNNNNGVFTKLVDKQSASAVARRHSTQDNPLNTVHEVSGGKLVLTRPRSFQPTSFSRKRESSLTDSRKVDLPPRGRIQSSTTSQEKSKSCVLGSPKFLRKWDSELSGLNAKRRREHAQSSTDNEDANKSDSEILSVEERRKKFQVQWETAI